MKILYKFKLKIVTLIMFVLTLGLHIWSDSYTAAAYSSIKDSTKLEDKSFDEDSTIDDVDFEEPAEIISMISLIANPEKYHEKIIRVIGYLNLEFEGNAIYLHKEDFENFIFRNGLWVDLQSNSKFYQNKNNKNINGRYVILQGTFDMNRKGHGGMWSDAMRKITSIDVYK